MSCTQVFYYIEPDLKQLSEHAPLIVNLFITSENICILRMVLKYNSEKKAIFLLSISEGLSQLNFSILYSISSLNSLSEIISRLFADYWTTYIKKITVTT